MTNDLVKEMAERLGRSGPEVEKALSAFASAVADRLQSDGEAHLAGLGTLRRSGDSYAFDPSDALSQAVNYRWLGSNDPVAAASDGDAQQLDPRLSVPAQEEMALRKASWAAVDPTALESGLDPVEAQGPAIPSAETAPSDPGGPPLQPEESVPAEQPPPAPEVPGTSAAAGLEDVAPLVDDLTYETLHQSLEKAPAAAAASTGKPAARSRTPRRTRDREGPSRIPLYGGIVVILVVAIAGLFWFQSRDADGEPEVVQNLDPAAGEAAEPDSSAAAAQDPTQGEAAAPQSPAAIQADAPGYTLVVGSSLSPQRAEVQAERFRSLGLPVGVLSYESDGQTRYRIAVGQYESAAEADRARRTIDGLPEGTWVRRIRP